MDLKLLLVSHHLLTSYLQLIALFICDYINK